MKTISSAIVIIALITLFGGCYMIPGYIIPDVKRFATMSAQEYKAEHTFRSRDDFEKETKVTTSYFFFTESSPTWECYYFTATKVDNENIIYKIVLYTIYERGWAFWHSAKDQNGNKFTMERIDLYRDEIQTKEWASTQLTREYLESIRKTGITWRFYGSHTVEVAILPQIVDGFLMRVDEVFPRPPPRLNANEMTAQQFKEELTFVSRDESQKTTTIESSRIYTDDTDSLKEYYQFIATKKDNEVISYEIIRYSNRMPPDLLERATDQNENEIPLKEIKTNVTGGGVTEKWYSVQVDRETLEKMRKTKNPLKLYSKTVKIKLGSLPQAVDGFLMRVDEVFPPRTNANEMTAQQHKDTSTFVSRDDSQKTTTVKSSQLYTEDTGFLREYHQFIATKKDDGTVSYEIICYSNRTPPDLFEKAVDQNGNEIPLKEIKTSVTKDGITEKWHSVQVSRDFLENMRRAKKPMTLYSKTISFKLTTEPQVVDGFLMRVDEALKE